MRIHSASRVPNVVKPRRPPGAAPRTRPAGLPPGREGRTAPATRQPRRSSPAADQELRHPAQELDVVELPGPQVGVQGTQHAGRQVDARDPTAGPDSGGSPHGERAAAAPDVEHGFARPGGHGSHQQVGDRALELHAALVVAVGDRVEGGNHSAVPARCARVRSSRGLDRRGRCLTQVADEELGRVRERLRLVGALRGAVPLVGVDVVPDVDPGRAGARRSGRSWTARPARRWRPR